MTRRHLKNVAINACIYGLALLIVASVVWAVSSIPCGWYRWSTLQGVPARCIAYYVR